MIGIILAIIAGTFAIIAVIILISTEYALSYTLDKILTLGILIDAPLAILAIVLMILHI